MNYVHSYHPQTIADVSDTHRWEFAREIFLMLMVKRKSLEIGRLKSWRYRKISSRMGGTISAQNLLCIIRDQTMIAHYDNLCFYAAQQINQAIQRYNPNALAILTREGFDLNVKFKDIDSTWLQSIVKSNIALNVTTKYFTLTTRIKCQVFREGSFIDLNKDYTAIDQQLLKLTNTQRLLEKIGSVMNPFSIITSKMDIYRVKLKFEGEDLSSVDGILSARVTPYL